MSEYTPDDEEYSTYALLNGKLESVEDIIDAVEQEQDHDERFLSYRILIEEINRLRSIVEMPELKDCFKTATLLIDNGVWLTEATLYESLKRYEKQLHLLEEARRASE